MVVWVKIEICWGGFWQARWVKLRFIPFRQVTFCSIGLGSGRLGRALLDVLGLVALGSGLPIR